MNYSRSNSIQCFKQVEAAKEIQSDSKYSQTDPGQEKEVLQLDDNWSQTIVPWPGSEK